MSTARSNVAPEDNKRYERLIFETTQLNAADESDDINKALHNAKMAYRNTTLWAEKLMNWTLILQDKLTILENALTIAWFKEIDERFKALPSSSTKHSLQTKIDYAKKTALLDARKNADKALSHARTMHNYGTENTTDDDISAEEEMKSTTMEVSFSRFKNSLQDLKTEIEKARLFALRLAAVQQQLATLRDGPKKQALQEKFNFAKYLVEKSRKETNAAFREAVPCDQGSPNEEVSLSELNNFLQKYFTDLSLEITNAKSSPSRQSIAGKVSNSLKLVSKNLCCFGVFSACCGQSNDDKKQKVRLMDDDELQEIRFDGI